ncbi:MAG: hypothetical protein V7721_08420 [Porticoccaceae bacterium]
MEATPAGAMDIFLQPGDFYFGDKATRIRTTLGSCVSIAIWHPKLCIGGMSHYLLPRRPSHKSSDFLSGFYAEDVMLLFMKELKRTNTKPSAYTAKIFGGGNMFSRTVKPTSHTNISNQNIDSGRLLMAQYGFNIQSEDLGGAGHRNISFDVWSGDVWVKRVKDTI